MGIFFNKVFKYLILGLVNISVIIVVALIINVVYPKYDFYVRDDTVYKLNKITGEVTRQYLPTLESKFKTLD